MQSSLHPRCVIEDFDRLAMIGPCIGDIRRKRKEVVGMSPVLATHEMQGPRTQGPKNAVLRSYIDVQSYMSSADAYK